METKKGAYLFFCANVVMYLAANFAHPVTPTLFKSLGLGDYMFGYAFAAMMTVNFFFSPFWGKINSFISSKYSMVIACAGYAVSQFFFGIARTELHVIGARMLAGVFTSGTFVSAVNYVINTSSDSDRGTYLTVIATLQSVASAFGFFIGGMLGERSVQLAIMSQAVCLLVCAVLFAMLMKNDARVPLSSLKLKTLVREANPFSAFLAGRQFMSFLLITFFSVCALQQVAQIAFDQSFNYYLRDQFGFSSGYNGVIKAVMGFVTLAANSTVCIYLMKRTDVRKSIIYVFALSAVAMTGVVVAGRIVPFILMNILFYGLSAIAIPMMQSMAASASKGGDSNLIMSFYNALRSLGGIIGALLAGSLYTLNPKFPFVCALISCAAATMCAMLYYAKSSTASAVAQSSPTV